MKVQIVAGVQNEKKNDLKEARRSDIQGSLGPRLEHSPAGRVSVGGFTANDYGKIVILALASLPHSSKDNTDQNKVLVALH